MPSQAPSYGATYIPEPVVLRARRYRVNYISACVKYSIFFFNLIFWVLGGLLIGVGFYAFIDKWQSQGFRTMASVYQVIFDISIIMIIVGGVMFIVSFAGCLGALRENTCLLKFYSALLLLFFISELALATMAFAFPHKVVSFIDGALSENLIQNYREDPDLQNIIDFTQQQFSCCGLSSAGYLDWSKNEYFNCTEENPSAERCAVPFSCCRQPAESGLNNVMCGYGAQKLSELEASRKFHLSGCIGVIEMWASSHLYTVAGVALGLALTQLLVIFLSRTLESQIASQKAQWT